MAVPSRVNCSASLAVGIAERFMAPRRGDEFGQTEIQNLGVTTVSDKNVAGFDVSMNNALAVSRAECVRNLDPSFQDFFKRERFARNVLFQGLPLEVFHSNEGLSVVIADFIDGANIGMIQCGSSLSFAFKAAQSLRIWRESVRKELQGNEAVQLGVFSLVHNTHTAAAELFDDTVMRDGLAKHGQAVAQS